MLAVLPGDNDFNGSVQVNDYAIWKANYGEFGVTVAGDGNGDGVVDGGDYVRWRNNLGKTFADVPPDPPASITVRVTGASSIEISWESAAFATSYTVQRRRPEVPDDPFINVALSVVGLSYTDNSVVAGTVYEYQVIAQNGGSGTAMGKPVTQQHGGGDSKPSQRASVTAGQSGLTAFRPQQFHDPDDFVAPIYAPFARHAVAEIDEESPTLGPGIRINSDDDNGNTAPDLNEFNHSVFLENDLIEVRVDRFAGQGDLILQIGTRITLYYTFDKEIEVPFQSGSNTQPLDFVDNSVTVFVEWVSAYHGTDPLRLLDAMTMAVLDTVRFHTFHSAVVFLGGEFQTPHDPVRDPGNHGVFDTAIDLYANWGYDVRMYDEDDVAGDGTGVAFDEIRNSINNQGYTEVALIGYSHGGGSVYDLSLLLQQESTPPFGTIIQPFTITMTSYLDAIATASQSAETRRPEFSEYHLNQYQQNTGFTGLFLNGAHTSDLEELDDEVNLTGTEVVHTTIDDDFFVLFLVHQRVRQKVMR